jgi:hypothetical protein
VSLLLVGTTTYVEEIGGLSSMKIDDVKSGLRMQRETTTGGKSDSAG